MIEIGRTLASSRSPTRAMMVTTALDASVSARKQSPIQCQVTISQNPKFIGTDLLEHP